MAKNSLTENVLTAEELMNDTFYQPQPGNRKKAKESKEKPTHYKVCCISLYTEDIERLNDMVKNLKSRGHTKANKSQIIRYALATCNLDKIPKGY